MCQWFLCDLQLAEGFAPKQVHTCRVCSHLVHTQINSTRKCLKFIFLLQSRKDNIVGIMKQNNTKCVYLFFFNPLKVKVVKNEVSDMNLAAVNSNGCETGNI